MGSKEYFDQVAQKWDEMRESLFTEEVREKALSRAGVEKGKTAADIGAGTGFITKGLVQRGLQVIAVDQSEVMLNEMKMKFSHLKGIDYRLGEAEKLPISNESVDYAFANMYLHHVESPLKAIQEMGRILKKGGKLVITDMNEHHFEFLREEQHDRWMGFKREEIHQWFIEAGLSHVIVDPLNENCCSESRSGNFTASVSLFVAVGVK